MSNRRFSHDDKIADKKMTELPTSVAALSHVLSLDVCDDLSVAAHSKLDRSVSMNLIPLLCLP
jgi:hypothetical protein